MRFATAFVLFFLTGCSSERSVSKPAPSHEGVQRARAEGVLNAVRLHPAVADRRPSPWRKIGEQLDVRLPLHADEPTHLAIAGAPEVSLEVRPLGLGHVRGERVKDAWVAVDALPESDVVQLVDARGFEELRLLRAVTGPRWSARYHLERGTGLASLRVREGRVEALDVEGHVRIATGPLVAWGGDHVQRSLEVSLVGDELDLSLDTDGLALPITVDPAWVATASGMATAHNFGPALVLSNGKVMVFGGANLARADLFDPTTSTFSSAPTYPSGTTMFDEPGAALLPSGDVLAGGGWGTVSGSPARYNPSTNTWSTAPNMPTNVGVFVPLLTGPVLHVPVGATASKLYDPGTNTWSTTGSLGGNRQSYQAVRLSGGTVLIMGGSNGTSLSTAEIYNPSTGTYSPAANLLGPRSNHRALLLGDGTVLVAGGYGTGSTVLSTTEIYSPSSGLWTSGPPMTTPRANFGFVAIGSNKLLAVGGNTTPAGTVLSSAELYDVPAKTWRATSPMLEPRATPAIAYLPTKGSVLVAGGTTVAGKSTAELFSPGANGTPCLVAGDCTSGNCADGYCCNVGCNGACQACDVAGAEGSCSAISGAPRTGHATCGSALCSSGSCITTCSGDGDCVSGAYCAGTCQTKKTNGNPCSAANECSSGVCADGVCCNTACAGACLACNLTGTAGTCSPRPATTACGALSSCTGSTVKPGDHCSGTNGTCVSDPTSACPGALKCASATTCLTRCTSTADCATGICNTITGTCDGSTLDAGTTDTGVVDTGVLDSGLADTGSSTDASTGTDTGVVVSDAAGIDAAQPTEKPTVVGTGFIACVVDSECSTGHCVDGVCCDTACTDRCHTCVLPSSPGKCVEEPVGVDLRGDCGAASQCLSTCGPGGECIGAGAGTLCARSRCLTPSTGVGPAVCTAPGVKCKADAAVRFDCGPFACDPVFGACRASCATTSECAPGHVCDVGQRLCVPAGVPSTDDSGCNVQPSHGDLKPWLAGFGLLVALAALRRR